MKIVVINPNSSASMTKSIGETARSYAVDQGSLQIFNCPSAPASIEGYSDGVLAAQALIPVVKKQQQNGAEGFVIACFDDTGVDSVRELVDGPVIGIGEAAMHAASIIGSRFSIITSLKRSIPIIEDNGKRYGLLEKCRGIHAFDLPVLSFEEDRPAFDYDLIADTARQVILADGSDTLVLGCGGMTHLRKKLADDLGVQVVDGVGAGVKFIEGLIMLGLGTSKKGAYAAPCGKPI